MELPYHMGLHCTWDLFPGLILECKSHFFIPEFNKWALPGPAFPTLVCTLESLGELVRIQMPGIPELLRWLVVSRVQWRLRITAVVIFFFKINEFYLEILCWTQSLFKFFLRCYRKPFGQPSDFRLNRVAGIKIVHEAPNIPLLRSTE